MARAKEYANGAERQAAYRARHRERAGPTQGLLAALARSLHGRLQEAAEAGVSPLPGELITSRADETLRNLIVYLRERCPGPSPEESRRAGRGGEEPPETP
jgi:hypothetical protein